MRRLGAVVVAHWELKVVALVMAFVLWLFVVSTDKSQLGLAAPVEYGGLGSDIVIVGPRSDTVDVEVQALRWAVARLTAQDVRVHVDLEGMPIGESVVAIGPEQVTAPPGVRVTRITPARLRLTLARAAVARLAVTAQLRGQPAAGFVVAAVSVQPETVQVRGPKSTMERRASIETEAVDVSGSQTDVIRTVGLVLPESMEVVKDRAVQVKVEIRKRGSRS
jgi:YbbR domain-containing protein